MRNHIAYLIAMAMVMNTSLHLAYGQVDPPDDCGPLAEEDCYELFEETAQGNGEILPEISLYLDIHDWMFMCFVWEAHEVNLNSSQNLNLQEDPNFWSCPGSGPTRCRDLRFPQLLEDAIEARDGAGNHFCTPEMVAYCQANANGRVYLDCTAEIGNIHGVTIDQGGTYQNRCEQVSSNQNDHTCEKVDKCIYAAPPANQYKKEDAVAAADNLVSSGDLAFSTDIYSEQIIVPLVFTQDYLNDDSEGPLNPTYGWPTFYHAEAQIPVFMPKYPAPSTVWSLATVISALEFDCEQDQLEVSTNGGANFITRSVNCACDALWKNPSGVIFQIVSPNHDPRPPIPAWK